MTTMKWEYRSEGNISTTKMNQLGSQGWEMVGYTWSERNSYCYMFKRAYE